MHGAKCSPHLCTCSSRRWQSETSWEAGGETVCLASTLSMHLACFLDASARSSLVQFCPETADTESTSKAAETVHFVRAAIVANVKKDVR